MDHKNRHLKIILSGYKNVYFINSHQCLRLPSIDTDILCPAYNRQFKANVVNKMGIFYPYKYNQTLKIL